MQSRTELYYKIINEPPISIRQFIPNVSNAIDNLLSALLEKENYKRPNSVPEILKYFDSSSPEPSEVHREFLPSFSYVLGTKNGN